jgi:DNA repair photolyase
VAVIEIQAKTILAHNRETEPLFGIKYNMNLYRGCQHQCIYCDSRSACYEIENFNHDVLVKVNAIDLLRKELPRKRVKGVVGTGSMNDPYMPLEKQYRLTGRALEVIAEMGFGVQVITKSDLVLRDIDLLDEIRRVHTLVTFSISTTDDELGRQIEPGAPPPSARFAALQTLAARGIYTGISLMPVLPFLEDSEDNISAVVRRAADCGASYILPWFGMSMRDRQREHFYQQLDRLFPGLRTRYENRYGERYDCPVPDAARLARHFEQLRKQFGIANRVPAYHPPPQPTQMTLF